MAAKEPDKVQREIEELLDKLDNFVPEERLVSKINRRRRDAEGPGLFERVWMSVRKRMSNITVGHILLLGIALTLLASFVPGLFGGYSRPVFFLGLILSAGALLLSLMGWDSRRTITGGPVERRWRGQVISYSQPTPNRFRNWWRRRGK